MSFVLLGILNAQALGGAGGANYEYIEAVDFTTTQSSVTFSNIDSSFTNLRLVGETNGGAIQWTANGNTNSYEYAYLFGDNQSADESIQTARDTVHTAGFMGSFSGGTIFELNIFDINNTNKQSTATFFRGSYANTNSNGMSIGGGTFKLTDAITSLTITASFGIGQRISLYGWKD